MLSLNLKNHQAIFATKLAETCKGWYESRVGSGSKKKSGRE
jgi:hypothetical protein